MAWFGFPMLNATFNNISVRCIVAVSFIGGGNQRPRRKPPTCRKSLTNLSHNVVHFTLIGIRTHNVNGDMHCLHR